MDYYWDLPIFFFFFHINFSKEVYIGQGTPIKIGIFLARIVSRKQKNNMIIFVNLILKYDLIGMGSSVEIIRVI